MRSISIYSLLVLLNATARGFYSANHMCGRDGVASSRFYGASSPNQPDAVTSPASKLFLKSMIALSLLCGSECLSMPANAFLPPIVATPERGFQTKSGLRYFDLAVGKGPSPRYGQLVSFEYTALYQSAPSSPFEVIYSTMQGSEPFLHKHGNGRILRGVDEALHTMKIGGKRRAFIPPSLGYVDVGIGPLPEKAAPRKRLGQVVDLVEAGKGTLIFDLELVAIIEDENDRGYYDDIAISPEKMIEMMEGFRKEKALLKTAEESK